MGYESKIFLVREHKEKNGQIWWNEVIASFNMCKMGSGFVNLFDKPCEGRISLYQYYDYDIVKDENGKEYIESHDTIEDSYGKAPTQADLRKVYDFLRKSSEHYDYWRSQVLMGFLEKAIFIGGEDLKLVHIGY